MTGHLVARQVFDIRAPSRAEAEALAARTSAAAGAIAATIERLLDRHDRPGERIRIDRIDIDLGACSPDQWEAQIVAGLERRLGQPLAAAMNADGGEARDEAAITPLALLGAFARTGRLPWWGGRGDSPAAAVRALAQIGAEPSAVRRLLALPGAIDRLVLQLDDAELTVLARLAGAAPEALAGPELKPMPGAQRLTRWQTLFRATLGDAAPPLADSPSETAERALADSPATPRTGATNPARAPAAGSSPAPGRRPSQLAIPPGVGLGGPGRDGPSAAATPALPAAAQLTAIANRVAAWEALAMELGRLVRGLDAATQARIDAAIAAAGADGRPNDASMLRSTIAALAGLGTVTGAQATAWQTALDRSLDSRGTGGGADPAAPQTASPPRSVALQADADHDALAIGDAGLPLVWPFLPQFFGGLGLADKAGFLDDAARHRAAAILFHLATGERDVDETRAVLPKVLTGIPLDALLRSRGPISDDEATAVERLLAALLGHAPMLGKLSVDGLRAAFLLRPGSLATHAGQWLLRVERQGHDVLLDRLPWSFGWVKLPWMAAPLQVDW